MAQLSSDHHSKHHAPISRLTRPFIRFLHIESSGGIVLLVCTVIAMIAANSSFSDLYVSLWKTEIGITIGSFKLDNSLGHWINDGLMTIFFFVVGLEIKRELISGELKDIKAATLPIVAAAGGMIVPAIIYSLILNGAPGSKGWGIPMATDIAFVVGFMAILGNRVPRGLKIFLLSLAIADDIGAVIIIALFYSTNISYAALLLGALGFIVTMVLNRLGVRRVPVYIFVGVLIWLSFLFSGIHPTVAGVVLGLLTPASAWIGDSTLLETISSWIKQTPKNAHDIHGLVFVAKESLSPLERLEAALHPWVAFFIIPMFALANAGVPFSISSFNSTISYGVLCGLFFGKVLGISLFSFMAVRLIGSQLPSGTNWLAMLGAGFLAGIGFTMSIFIASLAFDGSQLIEAKAGTILGSTASTLVGLAILRIALPKR